MRAKTDKINNEQMVFLEDDAIFPSTRFQGSKLKIVDWIWDAIKDINFDTALDAFGGTGSVGYMLKTKGKQVTYNDILKFNWYIGTALIENGEVNFRSRMLIFSLKDTMELNIQPLFMIHLKIFILPMRRIDGLTWLPLIYRC